MTSSPFPLYVFTPVRQRKCSIVLQWIGVRGPQPQTIAAITQTSMTTTDGVTDGQSDATLKSFIPWRSGRLMEGYDDATYHEIAAYSEMPIDRDTKAKQTLDRFIADATASQSP